MWYLVSFFILTILYVFGIFLIKYINKNRMINMLIPVMIFSLYLVCLVYLFFKVGVHDWNFKNVLPTANISPFMFSLIVLIPMLPNHIKKHLNTLVSSLALGMFVAGSLTLLFNAWRDYNFYWNFFLDSFIHILFSLYGIYLYKTEQVFYEKKKQVLSSSIIVCVAVIMLILNLIFETSFFGLSLYGNHNIYNIVVCKNSILSAVIYFFGLICVLFFGLIYQKIIYQRIKSSE